MDPFTLSLIIGGGAGLIKGLLNEEANKKQNKFREEALRYAPWTRMADPGGGNEPDAISSMFGGLGMGAQVGNMLKKAGGSTGTGGSTGADTTASQAAPTASDAAAQAEAPASGGFSFADLFGMNKQQGPKSSEFDELVAAMPLYEEAMPADQQAPSLFSRRGKWMSYKPTMVE